MINWERINVDRLAGELLQLVRAVESLSIAGREYIGQQIAETEYIFREWIKPQISGSPEAYEMERMLRAMEDFTLLDRSDWKRLSKARRQTIDVIRATTELVVRRFLRNVIEHGNTPES